LVDDPTHSREEDGLAVFESQRGEDGSLWRLKTLVFSPKSESSWRKIKNASGSYTRLTIDDEATSQREVKTFAMNPIGAVAMACDGALKIRVHGAGFAATRGWWLTGIRRIYGRHCASLFGYKFLGWRKSILKFRRFRGAN
jgi:hypothetical protein